MKKFLLIGLVAAFLLAGCAGLDVQYQRDMGTNAGIWGLVGAGTGAAIAAATGGKIGKAALLGGVIGAYAGAANTPLRGYGYSYNGYGNGYGWRGVDCAQFPTKGEQLECERGRADIERQIQYERERRAYEWGRGGW
jgi:hypothetical protein